MLTVIAWIIFVPALIWNMMFGAAFITIVLEDIRFCPKEVKSQLAMWENWKYILISLSFLFIPGIYLFGIF